MKTLGLVVLLISVLVMPAFAYDWVTNPANGHRYTSWANNGTGWQGAENRAVSLGGHLVTVNDSAENEWIRSTFGPFDFCWIGLYETDYISRQWAWVSGETLDFTYWGFGEPSGPGAEHWVTICNWSTPPGSWADLSTDWVGVTHIAVVEVVPEPSGIIVFFAGLIVIAGLVLMRRPDLVPSRACVVANRWQNISFYSGGIGDMHGPSNERYDDGSETPSSPPEVVSNIQGCIGCLVVIAIIGLVICACVRGCAPPKH